MRSFQFPFSVQTQTSKWKSSASAIFLSYSNEWIWCYGQGSECKIYKLFRHFLGVCYFCSRSGLIRWTLDKTYRRKAKLMRKSFVELGWGFRPRPGSCIRALAQAGTRLRIWDGLVWLPWLPLAWPQLTPAQNSCSSPLTRALGSCIVFLPIPPQNLSYYNMFLVVSLDHKLSLDFLQVLFDKKELGRV